MPFTLRAPSARLRACPGAGSHRAVLALAALAAAVSCSHGGSTYTPPIGGGGVPTPASTGSSSGPDVTAVTNALQSAQSAYSSLPHTSSIHNDLTTLAQQLVSSGTFASATVGYGGITAALKDGTQTLIFADHPERLGYVSGISPSSARRRNAVPLSANLPGISGTPAAHDIVFLCDTADTTGAFDCGRQGAFLKAFQAAAPVNAAGDPNYYSIDGGEASLDNILALHYSHNVDLFAIQARGMVIGTGSNLSYAWESTTPVTTGTKLAYLQDAALGNIVASITLQYSGLSTGGTSTGSLPRWAFRPGFLTTYMHFNNGAIFDNEASLGSNQAIAPYVEGALSNAGVGTYIGWSKEVTSLDADQTAAFMYDRMLGDAGTDPWLTPYAQQHTPPQRPFDLTDVFTAASRENRAGPMGPGDVNGLHSNGETYATSDVGNLDNTLAPPAGSSTVSTWFPHVMNSGQPLDEYHVPSIASMNMTTETFSAGTLAIHGDFPATPGRGYLTDPSGVQHELTLTWGTSTITAPLPASGTATAGNIYIVSADGFISNTVPLTQWSGTVTYDENDTLNSVSGTPGTGRGALEVVFNLTFRDDVHPTVPAIDQSPVPQKLYFPQVEGNSTATVTVFGGKFISSQGTPPPETVNFGLGQQGSQMLPVAASPIPQNTFIVGAISGQPSPCTDASPGPVGPDGATTLCPGFGYKPGPVAFCSDSNTSGGALCTGSINPAGSFGGVNLMDPGIVTFAIDPATYAITVNGPDTSFLRPFGFADQWPADATVTGTIGTPVSPPTSRTPALRSRSPLQRVPSAATRRSPR